MPPLRQLPVFLVVALALLALPRPGAAADPSPLAKGPLEKIDLETNQLTVKTKTGSRTFAYTERTYFFRGKQKISAEELHPGEVVALRFTTDPEGKPVIQRLKAPPAPAPAAPGERR